MIYEAVPEDAPLAQGDIFLGLPRFEVSLDNLPVLHGQDFDTQTWEEVDGQDGDHHVLVKMEPTAAIVATQACDMARAPSIHLFGIRPFDELWQSTPASLKAWVDVITKHSRVNARWFYLPSDQEVGLTHRMGVDFRQPLEIANAELQNRRGKRLGRLNEEALHHFRQKLAQFYTRFAHDEWYPLNAEEFAWYQENRAPEAHPRDWQKDE